MRKKIGFGLLIAALPITLVFAKRAPAEFHHGGFHSPSFALAGRPLGGSTPAGATPAYLTASRIAAVGEDALVIDADSGKLVREQNGKLIASLAIGNDAGLLAYDPDTKLAYVADRMGDRIAVVSVGSQLELKKSIKTPFEPYGVALSPDRTTVFVTTIADRTLVAYDTATGSEKWRTALAREPRGLAIAPDGSRALVSYLTTGAIDQIDLTSKDHRAEHIALTTGGAQRARCRGCSNSEEGGAFARASFAVTFMGAHQAIVPFQRETPVQITDGRERTGSYGGGFEPPISHQVAFIGFGNAGGPKQISAQIAQHQPRALAWDGKRDALYIAGLGSDTVLQIKHASQVTMADGGTRALRTTERCGPDGLAVTPTGDVLVWCSFTRAVKKLDIQDTGTFAVDTKVVEGTSLVASRYTSEQHKGMVLFHAADHMTSQRGAMACSSCHPDNRADGLSWRIEKHELQTPVLAGRMVGTHPYKWDGGDVDLKTSLTMTMKRLGGSGLDPANTAALQAFVEQIPSVRPPARDPATVARGRQLFDSAELGCRTCHDGKTYADNQQHKLTGTLAQSDTPSLLGLAASAPYYHDGSAPTLESLLRDRAAVHGMSDTTKLGDPQLRDLIAFLESL